MFIRLHFLTCDPFPFLLLILPLQQPHRPHLSFPAHLHTWISFPSSVTYSYTSPEAFVPVSSPMLISCFVLLFSIICYLHVYPALYLPAYLYVPVRYCINTSLKSSFCLSLSAFVSPSVFPELDSKGKWDFFL